MPSSLSRLSRTALFNALRFTFRLAPLPQSTRDQLRQRFLDKYASLVPSGPLGHMDSTKPIRRPYSRANEKAIGYVLYSKGELPDPLPATLIAFYLPQFHSIPENDEWWGKGFTEWRNVTRALPQFEGHAQPRLPGELGFYDLRDSEVMRKQATLAREYGVGAFCFYFYWFGGKTLLETPLLNWLEDSTLDLSFCLCWANENWSRRWDGRSGDILIDQQHSSEDDLAFIEHVAKYLRDPRYLRIQGKPMLLVYRPELLPEAAATAARWRDWCRKNGVGDIHLVYVQSFERPNPMDIGFDAAVEFPPNLRNPSSITAQQRLINHEYTGAVLDWRELARDSQTSATPHYPLYSAVNPGWDNEPRRPSDGRIYLHASPRRYRDWLTFSISKQAAINRSQHPMVFINAWNEWAEGAVLEPDARLGYAYLDATRQALTATKNNLASRPLRSCVVVHAWYLDAFDEILATLLNSGMNCHMIVTTTPKLASEVRARLSAFPMSSETFVSQNRGRDILPFLRVANRLLDEGVDIVLKLHTKRSVHRSDGEAWRKSIISRLVDNGRGQQIMAAFSQLPDLGMVAPEGHIQPLEFYWGANADNVEYLTVRTGISAAKVESDTFVAGSMFWIRLEALRPLLDAHLDESEFESESGQVDGTFAHAVERVFGLCVHAADYRIATAASLCGEPEPPTAPYAYARRG